MSQGATVHLITGKGGTGKSSFAAALTKSLSDSGQGPVLLLELQSSGRALQILGQPQAQFQNQSLPLTKAAWGARLMPKETFKQYFSVLLSLGDTQSSFAQVTSVLRERFVDALFDNKVVSAFIDVCPGLEPAVLLGKIHWEATSGGTPERKTPWKHVVVDAPSTGHSLMLFKSTRALTSVFGQGTIFKQATEIMSFITNPQKTKIHLISSIEELPLTETKDLMAALQKLQVQVHRVWLNRYPDQLQHLGESRPSHLPEAWGNEWDLEKERWTQTRALIEDFKSHVGSLPCALIPEIQDNDDAQFCQKMVQSLEAPNEL